MKKQLLILLLVAFASLTSSAYNFYVDGIYYSIINGTEVYVTHNVSYSNSYSGSVTIPARVTGWYGVSYPVTGIDSYAFNECPDLTEVTIPSSVTLIGGCAFRDCTSLTSITIPDSVTSIGKEAFYNTALYNDDSNWENNVLYIDKHLIKAKTDLSMTYAIKEGILTIAEEALYGCSGLLELNIPSSVTSIGYHAFFDCISLYFFTIPDSVTSIGGDAFYNTGLYNDEFNWENNVLYIGKHLISAKTDLSGIYAIKEGTLTIADYAFAGCRGLTEVTIANSVNSIGLCAFSDCTSLTSVSIPNSVTSIGGNAFYDCTSLSSVTIPNSVTVIAGDAFEWCTSLRSISIPNSVTSIGDNAFCCCTSLTSITIPNSVTSIGDGVFSYCTSLTSITIPDSVTSIGDYAFSGCNSLEAFYGKYASYDNRYLIVHEELIAYANLSGTSCSIPTSVRLIGDRAFQQCTNLTSVTIPDSVFSIGYGAFSWCTDLTSITIPDSVTSIGSYAFQKCTSLASLIVENENPSRIGLGSDVFSGVPKNTCVLYVPIGSKGLYAVHYQWEDFLNIEEYDPAGVDDIPADIDDDPDAPYFDLMGRRIANPTHGLYIHNGKKIFVR